MSKSPVASDGVVPDNKKELDVGPIGSFNQFLDSLQRTRIRRDIASKLGGKKLGAGDNISLIVSRVKDIEIAINRHFDSWKNECLEELQDYVQQNPQICQVKFCDQDANPLFFHLMAGVLPHDGALLRFVIENTDDVNVRNKLGQTIIGYIGSQKSAREKYSLHFNQLITKGLKVPVEEHDRENFMKEIEYFVHDDRARPLSIPTHLAKNFIEIAGDNLLAKEILKWKYSYSREARFWKAEVEKLVNYLLSSSFPLAYQTLIEYYIEVNNDDHLEALFKKSSSAKSALRDKDFLLEAVTRKHSQTFRILIEAGADPLKQNAEGLNAFAVACRDQGRLYLQDYLKAIADKYGTAKAKQVIRQGSAGKDALGSAIRGRAYASVVNFLLDNGADINRGYIENLKVALQNRDLWVFQILLERGELAQNEKDLKEIAQQVVKIHDNPMMVRIFLDYAKKQGKTFADDIQSQLNFSAKQHLAIDTNQLFTLCRSGQVAYLQEYFAAEKAKGSDLSLIINRKNDQGKTMLYYAVAGKSYKSLVSLLLANGADVNVRLTRDDVKERKSSSSEVEEMEVDNVLLLSIKNHEPEVMKALMKENPTKINQEIINNAAKKVAEVNDAKITENFVSSLSEEQFCALSLQTKSALLECVIEGKLNSALRKILSFNHEIDLNEKFVRTNHFPLEMAIRNRNSEAVRLLSKEENSISQDGFEIVVLISEKDSKMPGEFSRNNSLRRTRSGLSSFQEMGTDHEKKGLLSFDASDNKSSARPKTPSTSISPLPDEADFIGPVGSGKTENIKQSYLDLALDLAIQNSAEADSPESTVVDILCQAKFNSEKYSQQELQSKFKQIGIQAAHSHAAECCRSLSESCMIM